MLVNNKRFSIGNYAWNPDSARCGCGKFKNQVRGRRKKGTLVLVSNIIATVKYFLIGLYITILTDNLNNY